VEPLRIQYRYLFEDGTDAVFDLEFDPGTLELRGGADGPPPDWTRLGFEQCSNCPLSSAEHERCPLAVKLVGTVRRFSELISWSRMRLQVTTRERTVAQETTTQIGLSSLMGLIMATSGCPHTLPFRPMARHHLPLASTDETAYRAVGTYLIAQYLVHRSGGRPDLALEGLRRIYEEVEKVNVGIAGRLRAATERDSTLNAVVLLDVFAKTLPVALDDSLQELRELFAGYLPPAEG
jgi:hypothetical protein